MMKIYFKMCHIHRFTKAHQCGWKVLLRSKCKKSHLTLDSCGIYEKSALISRFGMILFAMYVEPDPKQASTNLSHLNEEQGSKPASLIESPVPYVCLGRGFLSDSSFPSQTFLVSLLRYNRDLGVYISHLSTPQNYQNQTHSPRVRMLAESLRVLLFILTLLLCTTSGVSQDSHPEDPPSGGESSNQLSWPSAFWGLVGIAFNTATQPSGRIDGLPSSWGSAVKCSPIFCIINALQALNSIRIIRRDSELILVVAPHKYDADDEFNHTDVATLQRNTLFCIIAFILGPVLQATKLYACQGIFWTQLLATIYIASFLCDELTLSLLWLTGSTASRGSVTGLAEAVLRSRHSTPTSPRTALSDESRENGKHWMKYRARMTWFPACFFLLWFAGDAVAGVHLEVKKLHDLGIPDLTNWLLNFSLVISILVVLIANAVAPYNRVRLRFWMIVDVFLA